MESFWNTSLEEEEKVLRSFDSDTLNLHSKINSYSCNGTSSSISFRNDYNCYDMYPQKLMRTLGKKEGELESFKDLLTKAENALIQSEDAVDVSYYIYYTLDQYFHGVPIFVDFVGISKPQISMFQQSCKKY